VTDGIGGATYNVSVTPHGTVCMRLRDRVKVDMTIDGAVRLTNAKNNIILALSRSGASAALIHPNGRVHQYGSRVEIQARQQQGNNKTLLLTLYDPSDVPVSIQLCPNSRTSIPTVGTEKPSTPQNIPCKALLHNPTGWWSKCVLALVRFGGRLRQGYTIDKDVPTSD
ncbi:jg26425, partial [Pararge aegeria aegeria]